MKIWHVLGAANALCGPVAFGAWFSGAGQPELAFVLGFQCAAFAGMVLAFCIEERDERSDGEKTAAVLRQLGLRG